MAEPFKARFTCNVWKGVSIFWGGALRNTLLPHVSHWLETDSGKYEG